MIDDNVFLGAVDEDGFVRFPFAEWRRLARGLAADRRNWLTGTPPDARHRAAWPSELVEGSVVESRKTGSERLIATGHELVVAAVALRTIWRMATA